MAINPANFTTPVEVLTFIDDNTKAFGFKVFGLALMLMMTAVLFISLKSNGIKTGRAFAVTSAVMMVASYLLYNAGFLQDRLFFLYAIGFVLSIPVVRSEASREP